MGSIHLRLRILLYLALGATAFAQKYTGPRPPKTDVPYLLHASSLVETEIVDAREDGGRKDSTTYSVPGPSSQARTPLAEPIFLLATDKLSPESLELYKFEVKNGRRELTLQKRRTRPLRVAVTKVDNGLYRLEASETLENGEYGLSPAG